jgi:hypothetical protein
MCVIDIIDRINSNMLQFFSLIIVYTNVNIVFSFHSIYHLYIVHIISSTSSSVYMKSIESMRYEVLNRRLTEED